MIDSEKMVLIVEKGGPGSGYFGHAGRPGKRGGSAPKDASLSGNSLVELGETNSNVISKDKAQKIQDNLSAFNRSYSLEDNNKYGKIQDDLYASMIDKKLEKGLLPRNWKDSGNSSRGMLKNQIVTSVSDESEVSYDVVNAIIKQWAHSANDNQALSLTIQEAVSEEFGVELSDWQKEKIKVSGTYQTARSNWADTIIKQDHPSVIGTDDYPAMHKKYSDVYDNLFAKEQGASIADKTITRKVLRTIYNQTQRRFAEIGYKPDDMVTLFRGIGINPIAYSDNKIPSYKQIGKKYSYKANAIDSWSVSPFVARNFGSQVIGVKVPVKNIFSTCMTGQGCLSEGEIIAFGGAIKEVQLISSERAIQEYYKKEPIFMGEAYDFTAKEPKRAELPPKLSLTRDKLKDKINALYNDFLAGAVTLEQWHAAMQELIGKGMMESYMIGLEPGHEPEPRDIEYLELAISEQYDYLKNFVDVIAGVIEIGIAGLIAGARTVANLLTAGLVISPEEGFNFGKQRSVIEDEKFLRAMKNRAALYANSVVEPYWKASSFGLPLPAYPGDGTSQCMTSCKCSWNIVPLDKNQGDYDAYWVMSPAEHCQTCLQRAHDWNPLQIRGWNLVVPAYREKVDTDAVTSYLLRTLKGGAGSGYFGHAGRPGKKGGSAASQHSQSGEEERKLRVYNTYAAMKHDQAVPFRGFNSISYFVTPDNKCISTNPVYEDEEVGDVHSLPTHPELVARNSNNPHLRKVFSLDNGEDKTNAWGTIRNMLTKGAMRVREYAILKGETTVADIAVASIDNKTIRRIQKLVDDGVIRLDYNGKIDLGDLSDRNVVMSTTEFMQASSADEIFRNRGLKEVKRYILESMKGGAGSGYFGHAGRPGKRGGSAAQNGTEMIPDYIGERTSRPAKEMYIPSDVKRIKLYHATSDTEQGEKILSDEKVFPNIKGGKSRLSPVKDFLYTSGNMDLIRSHLLGGDYTDKVEQSFIDKDGRYGYLFELSWDDIKEIQPDEDSIGAMIADGEIDWLNRLAEKHLTRKQLYDIKEMNWYNQYAAGGKKLIKLMSDTQKIDLIRKGANIAVFGAQKIKKAYRFDKTQSISHLSWDDWRGDKSQEEIKKRNGDFISMMEEVTTKGGPGSGYFNHAGRPGKRGGSAPSGSSSGKPLNFFYKDEKTTAYILREYRASDLNKYPWLIHDSEEFVDKAIEDAKKSGKDQVSIYQRNKDGSYRHDKNWNFIMIDVPVSALEELSKEVHALRIERRNKFAEMLGMPKDLDELRKELGVEMRGVNMYSDDDKGKRDAVYDKMDLLLSRIESKMEENIGKYHTAEFGDLLSYYKNGADSSETDFIHMFGYSVENYSEFALQHCICTGKISVEDAGLVGNNKPQPTNDIYSWQKLPQTLWHVTTNSDAVVEDRLRSRFELGVRDGVGLSGGPDDTISFTESEKTARDIERTMQEAHAVASGKITIRKMLEAAEKGGGGVGYNWLGSLGNWVNRGKLPQKGSSFEPDNDVIYAKFSKISDLLELEDKKHKTESEQKNYERKRWDFWNYYYLKIRDFSGGIGDPVFFGTNWEKLATMNPSKIKIHKYTSKPKSLGYKLSSLGEWRTVGGDTVAISQVISGFEPDDIDGILGI